MGLSIVNIDNETIKLNEEDALFVESNNLTINSNNITKNTTSLLLQGNTPSAIPSWTWTKLTNIQNYSIVFPDTNNEWDSDNQKFVPATSGSYMFLSNIILWNTNDAPLTSGTMSFKIYKNEINFGETYSSVPTGSFNYVLPLYVGDYIEFYCCPSLNCKVCINKIFINKLI